MGFVLRGCHEPLELQNGMLWFQSNIVGYQVIKEWTSND